MYLVPALLALDAADAATAEGLAASELGEHAIHVGQARRLSLLAAATADFDMRVYVNRIELPPSDGAT